MIRLKELFDTQEPEIDHQNIRGLHTYTFSLPDKNGEEMKYRVDVGDAPYFIKEKTYYFAYVEFFSKPREDSDGRYTSMAIPGAQAFKIFSIVWKIIEKALNTYKMDGFVFSSYKNEKSRVSLYQKFADNINKHTKWKLFNPSNFSVLSGSPNLQDYYFMREDLLKTLSQNLKMNNGDNS